MKKVLISLGVVSILSAILLSTVDAQTTSPRLQGCLVALEAQPKFPLGAIKNTCSFPINFMYCLTDINSDAIITTKRCEGALKTQGISPGDTVGSETDRGKAYFYACKSPDVPQDERFVPGVGISAYCSSTPSYVQKVPSQGTGQERNSAERNKPQPLNLDNNSGQGGSDTGRSAGTQPVAGSGLVMVTTIEGCKVFLHTDEVNQIRGIKNLSWSGPCVGGYGNGTGSLTYSSYTSRGFGSWETKRYVGQLSSGALNGRIREEQTETFGRYGEQSRTDGFGSSFNMGCFVPGTTVDAQNGFVRYSPPCSPVRLTGR